MSNDRYIYLGTVGGPEVSDELHDVLWELTFIVKEARESLEPDSLVERLAEDAVYEAQDVMEPLVGKENIAGYLKGRFDFIRSLKGQRDTGRMIPATVDLPHASGHPCLIFEIDGERGALWVVTPGKRETIGRIDILTVAPHPSEARVLSFDA
jgi:hypothetical protein